MATKPENRMTLKYISHITLIDQCYDAAFVPQAHSVVRFHVPVHQSPSLVVSQHLHTSLKILVHAGRPRVPMEERPALGSREKNIYSLCSFQFICDKYDSRWDRR